MQTFLDEVVNDLIEKYPNPENLCIIFPNHLSRAFFKQNYVSKVSGVSWLPDLYSMNEWIVEKSGYQIIDYFEATLDFYKIYIKLFPTKTNKIKFDQFFYFANILIHDFSEIDKYLVSTKDIFSYVKDEEKIKQDFFEFTEKELKAIKNYWSLNNNEFIIDPKNFRYLWEKMPLIYNEFNALIKNKGLLYEGAAYKLVAEMVQNGNLNISDYDNYVFVGFFALNPCEKKIIDHLEVESRVLTYWDIDQYYLNKSYHEAGQLIKNELNRPSANIKAISNNSFTSIKKELKSYGAPNQISQVKLLNDIIGDLDKTKKTLIVIPDNTWVLPLLTSISLNNHSVRFGTGIPVRVSSFYQNIQLIIDFIITKLGSYNYITMESVIPVIQISQEMSFSSKLEHLYNSIIKTDEKYIKINALHGLNDYLDLFMESDSSYKLMGNLKKYVFDYYNKFIRASEDSIIKESVFQIYINLEKITSTIQEYNYDINIREIIRLCDSILNKSSIGLNSEPYADIYIFDILDTLAIDFDQVVFLGFNEGVWPPADVAKSYIIDRIKKKFDLPGREKQDAFYSYLFYRLIQRSEKVFFIYNNISSHGRTGEVSRFYHQLNFESDYKIEDFGLEYNILSKYTEDFKIMKSDEILSKLREYEISNVNERYLSSSAISDYISCPVKFCFKRVFKFKEKDDSKLSISNRGFGDIFHYSMEAIYSENKEVLIDTEFIKKIKSNLNYYINKAFKKYFKIDEQGEFQYKNEQIVIKEVIASYITEVLNYDLKKVPFEVLGVEKELVFKEGIKLKVNDTVFNLAFKAYIDRLDLKDNMLQLIDYKTGKTEAGFNSISDIFNQKKGDKLRSVFQALIYIWAYLKCEDINGKMIYNQLYALKSIHKTGYPEEVVYQKKKFKEIDIRDWVNEFENQLFGLINEIFDAKVPFEQTKEVETCKRCYFNRLCKR